MPSSSKFTTTGLRGIRPPPRITRNSFSAIHDFEKRILFPNPTYMDMSAERQTSIQEDVQKIFFDWMMSKRVERQTTTHVAKRKMYEDIVKKLLASVEVEGGLFSFLGQDGLPAFDCGEDLHIVKPEVEEPALCASRFAHLPVTGVIPFSRPIQLHWVPCSKPQTCSNASDIEEEMQPYLLPLSPTLDSISFLPESSTFPTLDLLNDSVSAGSAENTDTASNTSSVFEILPFPGVAKTLSDIWYIQTQISQILNGQIDYMDFGNPCNLLSPVPDGDE